MRGVRPKERWRQNATSVPYGSAPSVPVPVLLNMTVPHSHGICVLMLCTGHEEQVSLPTPSSLSLFYPEVTSFLP